MVSIRSYTEDDFEDLIEILSEGKLFYSEMETRDNLKNKINRNPGSILVAEANRRIVGSAFATEDGWASFVNRVAVHPSYRGNGVMSDLMESTEDYLRSRGYRVSVLFADSNNQGLLSKYEHLGYESIGDFKIMLKKLY